ncbi:MAG: rhodanese-like domain-containing protein [Actinobacteria bacterium]|nr:rhodanese-like domain-containing protein [Actinomycetota bacterium]
MSMELTPFENLAGPQDHGARLAGARARPAGFEALLGRARRVLASVPWEGDFIANGIWGIDLAALMASRRDELFVLDVRAREDYDAGHIEGAVHVEFSELALAEGLGMFPKDRKIIVVCQAGSLSAQAVSSLRLLGYDAAMLKTGMNGWAPGPGREEALAVIEAAAYPVIQAPPLPCAAPEAAGAFDQPAPDEREAVLARLQEQMQLARTASARVPAADLAGADGAGFVPVTDSAGVISPEQLHRALVDPDASERLFLLDLRREEDFEGVGHIDGAVRMDFDAALLPENLEQLPHGRTIVTICYSGNMAAQLAQVLRLLGHDAAVLAYGMVGWKRTPTTYLYLKDLQKGDNPVVSRRP